MKKKREEMVYTIKTKYGLESSDILSVMLQIPREKFAPKKFRNIAYEDGPVPIGFEQTMSQPYTVAFMTDLLDLIGSEKVLEVGTGSGYQAAVLSKLAREVYTVEIIPNLAENAKNILQKLGFDNVYVKAVSGQYGWPEKAPFDAILVTAGLGEDIPRALFDQLKYDGVLVAPVGAGYDKKMTRFTKKSDGKIEKEEFGIFHFVPFIKEKN